MNISNEDAKFLELYSDSEYEKPSVTVDSVILRLMDIPSSNYRKLPQKKLQVFLINRQFSPYKNCFAVPGTFINLENELTFTMQQCVKNKVNLTSYYYEQLFTFGDKSRDPRSRVLSVSYMLLTNSDENLLNGEWFNIDISSSNFNIEKTENGYFATKNIKILLQNETHTFENELKLTLSKNGLIENKSIEIIKSELAFDHLKLLFYALERLKNKIEYTDIIFNLLKPKFTLTELKQSYEVILNEKLLDANFRRKINNMVQPLDEFDSKMGHRPSQIFIHNKHWKLNNID